MTRNSEIAKQAQEVSLTDIWEEMERALVEMYAGGIRFMHPDAIACVANTLKRIRAEKLQCSDNENTEVSGDEAMMTVMRTSVAFRKATEKVTGTDTVHQLAIAIELFRSLINEGQRTSEDAVSSTLYAVRENLGENATISNSQQADRSHVQH